MTLSVVQASCRKRRPLLDEDTSLTLLWWQGCRTSAGYPFNRSSSAVEALPRTGAS